ncbi:MAG: transglycosylase SLT domain-containing protein [Desulfotignum sp.]|nr:transglycosylase SLT domain-containing protein [Desulfotignum sp.]MCF8112423.1 transglycosylase SLT domain-containing protein [Desulfotignum sp.]MCF8124764.1 transglycosylase SLT domain-containing protein [Desulfotignum sp.]
MRYLVFISLLWIMVTVTSAARGFAGSDVHVTDFDREFIPSLVQSIRFPEKIVFCHTQIPLEDPQVKAQLEKAMLLALWSRPQVILWLKRSAQLFPHIQQILAEEQMPDDLKYVPVIESALRPHASSFASAVGYWQFLKATGRRYGLRIDSRMDERRNIFKSTRAACLYLKKLFSQFGSFPLALAAYNMGEHGLEVEIEAQQTQNYFDLYLPLETQQYLYKMIAAKLILENPQKYGFNLEPGDLYPALRFARLNFTLEEELPLVLIARAAAVSFKTLKTFNPDIRGYYLAAGPATILVPEGYEKKFHTRFADLYKEWQKDTHFRIHVVKPGESLISIAREYDMTVASLLWLNNIPLKKVIHPGDRLKVK